MAIEFTCNHCNTTLQVPDEHAGKQARCPKCQALNTIEAAPLQPHPIGQSPFDASYEAPPVRPVSQNPYAASQASQGHANRTRQNFYMAHRGALVLTLGIVAMFCNFFLVPGILAWVYGRGDIQKMDSGQMDPEGRGITLAGMILGIVATALNGLILVFYILMIVITILTGF